MTRGLLLDTHTLLWYSVSPQRLPDQVLALVRNRDRAIYISAITAWELSIKFRLGKLPQAATLLEHYHLRLAQYGFKDLPFSSVHALKDRELTHSHKDPFDRALVAQALSEQLAVVSADSRIAAFPEVVVVWG
jgi:PIN domain nuclease of toxin-antitoxin system